MHRPIVGLTTHTRDADGTGTSVAWALRQRYVQVLDSAGALPWMIPLLSPEAETLRAIYERLDGVLIAGGADLDPATYGEAPLPACGRPDTSRDATELALVRWALVDGLPVLAICRGAQVLNVASGGTLFQDLGTQRSAGITHDYFLEDGQYARDTIAHEVRLATGSRLAEIVGAETLSVNSRHHQAVKSLGEGLVATAFAPDGLIEGVETANGLFAIGVQWHPEDLTDSQLASRRLFDAFVRAAVEYRAARTAGDVR